MASYVCRTLETQDYQVSVEPKLKTNAGLRKPDIVAKLETTAFVIDAQVVNDQIDLDAAHNNKVDYYRNIEECVKESYDVSNVVFSALERSVEQKISRRHDQPGNTQEETTQSPITGNYRRTGMFPHVQ